MIHYLCLFTRRNAWFRALLVSAVEKVRMNPVLSAAHTEALEVCPWEGELQVTAATGKHGRR